MRPAVEVGGRAGSECCGVQHAPGRRECLLAPECTALDAASTGLAHERLGPDDRRLRALAAPHERPPQSRERRCALGKTLRIEDCDRAVRRPCREGDRQVVRAGRGRDDGSGRVEDHRDHDTVALAGPWRAQQQHRVLHRCPAPDTAARPEAVPDVGRTRALQGRSERLGPGDQSSSPRSAAHLTAQCEPFCPHRRGRLVGTDVEAPEPPPGKGDEARDGERRRRAGPVDLRWTDRRVPRFRRVAQMRQCGEPCKRLSVR